jgi:hypothetical protein
MINVSFVTKRDGVLGSAFWAKESNAQIRRFTIHLHRHCAAPDVDEHSL